jgi:serine phosphatase RsbU (regulator of sigma subunit)
MTAWDSQHPPIIDWAWAGLGLGGEESGDLHTVVPLPHGVLLAVTDGLGHGPEAAAASKEAAAVLQANAERPLQEIFELCHEALRKTRGVVMSLVYLDGRSRTLEWCGIGNVEGVLLRKPTSGRSPEAITPRGGVVGYRLPNVKVSRRQVFPGDVLILATDGIRSGFTTDVDLDTEPQAIADAVFARHARGTDDALVLVARYLGVDP